MQPTSSVPKIAVQRTTLAPLVLQGTRPVEPAQFVTRGPLAARAHRLLGLGAAGSARLGRSMPSMVAAFGGDPATFHRVATPWVAARSLARPVESMPAQSSVSWLLGTSR